MTLAQFVASPFAVAGLAAVATLAGSLGSQYITARANLKSKRLDLTYSRKADAYRDFLTATGQSFITRAMARSSAPEPLGGGLTIEDIKEDIAALAKSYAQVLLVASNDLYAALDADNSFMKSLGEMYDLIDEGSEEDWKKLIDKADKSLDRIQELMRADLNRLGGL